MITIAPLIATDYGKACALLGLQEEPVFDVVSLTETGLVLRSLVFWQHWIPCQFHVAPSIYVAREEGSVLGFISMHNTGKAKSCWRIDNLVVHPEHRGRGIAQELLRYAFAQFGSQGVSHFIAEVAGNNDAALSLFASCGFCRSARVTYYRLLPNSHKELVPVETEVNAATTLHKNPLYQLNQEALPPDLRMVLDLVPEDFRIKELPKFTSVEIEKNRLMAKRVWYLICEETDRQTIAAAAKITAQPGLGYRVDLAIHPGWRHLTRDLTNSTINNLLQTKPNLPIWFRVLDFQNDACAVLEERHFERMGDFFLLSHEHWQRAKRPRKRSADVLKPIASPIISFPLATDKNQIKPNPC